MAIEATSEGFENRRDLRDDFAKLGEAVAAERKAAIPMHLRQIVSKTIEHSAKFDLIAVFDAEVDEFEVGRIFLFEDFVRDNTGIFLKHVKVTTHCIKVFFELAPGWRNKRELLRELFASELFEGICEGLDLSYVQFAGQLFPPQRIRK